MVVDDSASEQLQELHVIRFADAVAFDAYQQDERVAAAKHLRDKAVVRTQLFVGEEGPRY